MTRKTYFRFLVGWLFVLKGDISFANFIFPRHYKLPAKSLLDSINELTLKYIKPKLLSDLLVSYRSPLFYKLKGQ